MGLEDVGVVFISKGFQSFISNLGKASRSITDFGNMTKNKIQALRILNDTAVILSNDFKKMQTSADRVAISQQRTAQSANYLKTAQEKVKISANNAASSYNKWQKSINDASAAASRASSNIARLQAIDRLNQALVAGAINLDAYTTAALATNNQLRQLDNTASSTSETILNITQTIGSALGGLGGVFSSMASGGNMGAMIGGALGTIIPGIGNVIGGIAGYIMGALGGLGMGILKWITGLAASIGKSIINLGKKVINWIGSIFKGIINSVKGFLGTIFNMLTGGIFQSGWNNLGNTIVSSMFKFEILKQVIRKVVNEISDLSKEAMNGAIELQTFTARLNFLINSQVRMADSTLGISEAWDIASNEAQRLLTWIQKLSLSSPMKVEDISKTVSMAIAMGWTVDAAKTLTTSILDYTAAVGLGSEESERIIYNFAQMKNQGKVTGTELRDLGRGAFVPINKVLEIMYENLKKTGDGMKYANMSFEEFRKQAAAGQVDVEGFFTAFEEFVGTYMPNAMEKMNYTFKAVTTRMHNLFSTLLGWDILGPVIKTITVPLDNLIKKLSTDQVITNAKRIGVALSLMITSMKEGFSYVAGVFGSLAKAAGLAAPSIRSVVMNIVQFGLALKEIGRGVAGLIEKLLMPFAKNIKARYGSTFSTMRNDFFSWGAKLVLSFAQGMMKAAASALTAVMHAITNLLKAWLKPHSPPKVAPDIDKWGTKTIDEYYGGFADPTPEVVAKAKDSITSTTSDIVKSANQTIANIPNFDFGAISLSLHTFTQADFDSLDSVQSSLKDIISTLVTLGQVSQKESGEMFANMSVDLINAWAEFNKTGKISMGIFDQLRSLGGVWGTELANLLDLQIQLAIAVEQTAIAQKAYDDAVKASIKAETKVSKLIKDYNNILRKGADRKTLKNQLKLVNASEMEYAVAKKAEETKKTELDLAEEKQKTLEDQAKLQESLIKQMTELVQAQKDAAGSAADAAESVDELADAIGEMGFNVEPPWTDEDLNSWITIAQNNFSILWKQITDGWNKTWTGLFTDTKSNFQQALSDLEAQFAPAVAKLKTIWDDFAKNVGLPSAEDILAIWNKPTTKTVSTTWNGLIPTTTTTYSNTFVDKFYQMIQSFQTSIQEHGGITKVLSNIASYIITKIGELMTTLANDPTVTTALNNGLNALATFMNNVLTKGGTGADTPIGKLASGISSLLVQALNQTLAAIGPGTETWTALTNIGISIANGISEGILNALPDWLKKILIFNTPFVVPNALTSPKIPNPPVGRKPGEYVGPYAPETYNYWDNMLKNLAPTSKDLMTSFNNSIPVGTNIFNGIGQGITNQIPKINYSNIVVDTTKNLDNAFDSKSPSKKMLPVGNNLAEGIAKGLLDQINVIRWLDKIQPLINAVKNIFGIAGDGPSKVFDKIGQSLSNGLADGIAWVLNISTIVGGNIYNSFAKVINAAKSALGLNNPTANPFYLMGQSMVQGIINGFEAMIPVLIAAWNSKVVSKLPEIMRSKYEMSSPSKLFKGFGENIVEGLALGLSDFNSVIEEMTNISSMRLAPTVPMSATVSAPPVYGGTSVTFGDTYINNDMDWAIFKSRVQRAITER